MKYLILLVILLSSCAIIVDDDGSSRYNPEVKISSTQRVDGNLFQEARLILTLENTGNAKAYDIEGTVKLYRNNRVLETQRFRLSSLSQYSRLEKTVYLTSVKNHSDYEYYRVEMNWYDRSGNYYKY